MNLAMVWVRWSVVYWVGVATEPLLTGPFLFVLPLMVDRELGFRQATRLSL